MSPHVYPPSVTKSTFLGDTLWQQCALAFGYLENRGYCKWQGNCRKFPVVIGETGSFLHDANDKQWMQVSRPTACSWAAAASAIMLQGRANTCATVCCAQDFSDFVEAKGGARSYTSSPMAGWIWWCYNENSGDTGRPFKAGRSSAPHDERPVGASTCAAA